MRGLLVRDPYAGAVSPRLAARARRRRGDAAAKAELMLWAGSVTPPESPRTAYGMLVRLAALADRSGAVQIPIGELQALSGMSLRPVLRAVRGLVDAGLVRVEHPYRAGRGRGKGGGRLPNRYVLLHGQ